MSDVASLKITIDSKPLDTALNRLKLLEAQAAKTRKAAGLLSDKINRLGNNTKKASDGLNSIGSASNRASSGIASLKNQLAGTNSTLMTTSARAKKASASMGLLSQSMRTFGSLLAAYGGVQGVRFLADVSDEAINVRNRLRAVTETTAELNSTFDGLAKVSTDSRVSLQTSANLYQRMKMGTEALGLSQHELLRVTETINKSFKISGATADEASGSIRQLTQAFNANMLRGEELNSINEQAPILMKAIERQLGMTGMELRKFAETGGITAEIMIKAFESIEEEVDAKFSATAKTIEDRLLDIRREFVIWADETGGVTNTMNLLLDTLEGLGDVLRPTLSAFDEFVGVLVEGAGTFEKLDAVVSDYFGYTNAATRSTIEWKVAIEKARQEGGWYFNLLARLAKGADKLDKMFSEASKNGISEAEVAFQDLKKVTDELTKLQKEQASTLSPTRYKDLQTRIDELAQTERAYRTVLGEVAEKSEEAKVQDLERSAATDRLMRQRMGLMKAEQEALKLAEKRDKIIGDSLATVREHNELLRMELKATESGGTALEEFKAKKKALVVVRRVEKKLMKDGKILLDEHRQQIIDEYKETAKLEAAIDDKTKAQKEEEKWQKKVIAGAKAYNKVIAKRDKVTAGIKAETKALRMNDQERYLENKLREANTTIMTAQGQKIADLVVLHFKEKDAIEAKASAVDVLKNRHEEAMEEMQKQAEETAEVISSVFEDAFSKIGDSIGGLGGVLGQLGKQISSGGFGNVLTSFGGQLGGLFGGTGAPTSGAAFTGKGGAAPVGVDPAMGTSLMSSVNSMIPAFGPAVASSYASAIFKDIEQGDYGQLLDKALPGLFLGTISEKLGINFGGKPSDKTQTSQLQLGSGEITQGGFLSGKKFSERGREAADIATQMLGNIASQLTTKLGTELSGELEFIVGERDGIRVNFDGEQLFKSNSITETLEQATEFLFEMAGETSNIYSNLANDGESLGEAFLRLDTQLLAVESVSDALRLDLDLTGEAGLKLADNMVEAAGGIDALIASAAVYYDKFFTEQEKFEDLVTGLEKGFGDLNLTVPKTRTEFRNLVDSADEATQAMLMKLVPSLDQYISSLEGWEDDVTKIYEDVLDRTPDATGLNHWVDQLESGAMSFDEVTEAITNSDEAIRNSNIKESLENLVPLDQDVDIWTNLGSSIREATGYAQEFRETEIEESLKNLVPLDQDADKWANLGSSIREAALFAQELSEEFSDFAAELSLEATLAGLGEKDQDIFLLNKWKEDTLAEIEGYQNQGVAVLGGTRSNVDAIYEKRLEEINDRYKETVEVLEEESDVLDRLETARSTVISLYESELSVLEDFSSRMGDVAKSLREYSSSLLVGDLSPLSPERQYQEARRQFRSTASAAAGGDMEAMANLASVGDMFLNQSQDFQGSAGSYASDFDLVRSQVDQAAEMAEQQQTDAEQQIEQLKLQVSQTVELKEEVITLQEAIATLTAIQKEAANETVVELRKQTDSLGTLESNSDLQASAS